MTITKSPGKKIVTPSFIFLFCLAFVGLCFLAVRFFMGLGAVTSLTDHYPWGIWITLDVVVGTALACGGYAIAILVYILNRWKYHRIIRVAILSSLLGYTFAGLSVVIDLGRYWNVPNMFNPVYWQFNSIMLEVGLCVTLYVFVLLIEFSPVILKQFLRSDHLKFLHKAARIKLEIIEKFFPFVVALGILLPTMHQSSLGGLMVLVGQKLNPLWQTPLLPLLFLISCLGVGYAMVIFESFLSEQRMGHPLDKDFLWGLAKIMRALFLLFLLLRWGDLFYRGALDQLFNPEWTTLSFWVETCLLVAGLLIPWFSKDSSSKRNLLLSSIFIGLGCILYRFNVYLIGFSPEPGAFYFPSMGEMWITLGLVSMELILFIFIVKTFPVMEEVYNR